MSEEKSAIIFNTKSSRPTTTPSEVVRITRGGSFAKREKPQRKPRVISEEKFKEMAAKYNDVCIHDYGDEYHMSEEERVQRNRYYQVFSRLNRCKKKYRKINEFVNTFRLCLKCLQEVAEHNGVYSSDKFIKLALKGEITVFGLTFPRYIGKDRKSINWKYISEFIMSGDDPSILIQDTSSDYDRMSDKDAFEVMFTKAERDEIHAVIEEYIKNPNIEIVPYFGDGTDDDKQTEDLAVSAGKKSTKKFIESTPEIVRTVRESEKARRKALAVSNNLRSYSFEMTEDDYKKIEAMDKARGIRSDSDIPVFSGDIMNRTDYMRYLYRLHVYEMENIKENYNGKMRTLGDIQELELKEALEQAGWNLRALYKAKDEKKKLKRAYKADKKREEELKQKLLTIQKRQEKRKKKKGIEVNTKAKKKKKNDKEDE